MASMPGNPSQPARARARELGEQAVRLRARGWSFWRIAQELGVSTSAVHHQVHDELKRRTYMPTAAVELLREQELDRLLHLIETHDQCLVTLRAAAGNEPDAQRAVELVDKMVPHLEAIARLSDRVSRLMGLAMPVRVELDVSPDMAPDLSLAQLLRQRASENRETETT